MHLEIKKLTLIRKVFFRHSASKIRVKQNFRKSRQQLLYAVKLQEYQTEKEVKMQGKAITQLNSEKYIF